MSANSVPKPLKDVQSKLADRLKLVKRTSGEGLLELQQRDYDQLLQVYQEAFSSLINNTVTYSDILQEIKNAYENALQVRDKRIAQFITQDKVFGITVRKKQHEDIATKLSKEKQDLQEQNLQLSFEIAKLKKEMGKIKDDKFSAYLTLMRERDARYSLYFENLALQLKLKELDGGAGPRDEPAGDPVVLRIALDRCREALSTTQRDLKTMKEEYAETVPRRDYDMLETKYSDIHKSVQVLRKERDEVEDKYRRLQVLKRSLDEELSECRERCSELERAGTPRPHWEICADFISGGRDRWRQLSLGLSSRETLRALLKELGPAKETDHLEHFDGLGSDPSVPPYLRYSGPVRNLRLSRREVRVLVNDVWRAKLEQSIDLPMQDFLTHYFEHRYQQPSIRAEWAYNLCASAEQMLDEPQVRLFWGVLHEQVSERVYWGHRADYLRLKEQLYRQTRAAETITVEEFEKVAKAVFPLKSKVEIKSLVDAARRQLKLKLHHTEINLDKLFEHSEEGWERLEVSCELFRQRRRAQDRYMREVLDAIGARRAPDAPVHLEQLKRAFAIVDPAIDHVRMEQYMSWAFESGATTAPLRMLTARLAAGDLQRVGPRHRVPRRRTTHK